MSFIHDSRRPAQAPDRAGRLLSTRDRTAAVALTVLTALLAAGFVLAPRALTGPGPTHGHSLSAAASQAFTAYWRSGQRGYPPALAGLVTYWRHYHLAKAVFAVALTIALCWLACVLWRSLLRAGPLRPATTAAAVASGGAVTALAFGSLLVVMATVQGTLAPFSSLVSLLPVGQGDAALGSASSQIRHDLGASAAARNQSVTLSVIVDDFARYHAVLAVILVALAVLAWRRPAAATRATQPAKAVRRLLAASFALLAVVVLVICAANVATAQHPVPALLPVFGG
jgi:hypothetical protein